MECLFSCENCNLCNNQKPLLDKQSFSDILWVGLSAKKVDCIETSIPLSNDTNSGKIIESIEKEFNNLYFYKTNLVKCLPLDEKNKLRYPEKEEMEACFENLIYEIKTLKPKIVFLLGNKVANFVIKNLNNKKFLSSIPNSLKETINNITFETVYHPSYIYVYKRKEKDIYIENIKLKISNFFSNQIQYAS